MKLAALWMAIFLAHGIAQFTAWAGADSVVARWAIPLARVLMFPAFNVAGKWADERFWLVFISNSALWACASVIAIRYFSTRHA